MDNIFKFPKEIVQNRRLIWSLSKNDFKMRFAGSYLGIIWAFIQPVVTILVYWFVFQLGFRNQDVGDVPFVLWLIAGLVPWFFFQEALNNGTNALIEYNYLVKKVVFKIEILPVVKVISALFVHIFFVCFTLVIFSCYRRWPDVYTIQILYYSFAMLMFILALSYATSAIVVFFRDLSQIINIILQVGMWMSPIMWVKEAMFGNLPTWIKIILQMNPMYYIVCGYRDSLIDKVWFFQHPGNTAYFWILTIGLFVVGQIIFRRLKIHFADVL